MDFGQAASFAFVLAYSQVYSKNRAKLKREDLPQSFYRLAPLTVGEFFGPPLQERRERQMKL